MLRASISLGDGGVITKQSTLYSMQEPVFLKHKFRLHHSSFRTEELRSVYFERKCFLFAKNGVSGSGHITDQDWWIYFSLPRMLSLKHQASIWE